MSKVEDIAKGDSLSQESLTLIDLVKRHDNDWKQITADLGEHSTTWKTVKLKAVQIQIGML